MEGLLQYLLSPLIYSGIVTKNQLSLAQLICFVKLLEAVYVTWNNIMMYTIFNLNSIIDFTIDSDSVILINHYCHYYKCQNKVKLIIFTLYLYKNLKV